MHGYIDEEKLFAIIGDQIQIDEEQFYIEIKKQNWCYEKYKLFKAIEQLNTDTPSNFK